MEFIREHLFSKGHPLKAEYGLTQAVEERRKKTIQEIQAFLTVSQMTDLVMHELTQKASLQVVVLDEQGTKKERWVSQDSSGSTPCDIMRVTIPFSGTPDLIKFSPSIAGITFPRGRVNRNTIEFDVRIPQENVAEILNNDIIENINHIKKLLEQLNTDVVDLNQGTSEEIRKAFEQRKLRLQELESVDG